MQYNGQSNKEKMINCGLKMNETNQRMQRLELIINDKLSKLDMLDALNDKIGKFEHNLSNMQTEIGNIKSVQQKEAQNPTKCRKTSSQY